MADRARTRTKQTAPRDGVLLCTLGTTWLVVPEILGYLDPERYRVYPASWWRERAPAGVGPPAEVWAVTTLGDLALAGVNALRRYWDLLGPGAPALHVFAPEGVEDVAGAPEDDPMAELIYRLGLAARATGGTTLYSLAGGRKTMSSLLQKAAGVFGAERVFHVASTGAADQETRGIGPEDLAAHGLPRRVAEGIQPVDLGGEEPFEGLDWRLEGMEPVVPGRFPVEGTGSAEGVTIVRGLDGSLYREVESRRREAQRIAGNYFLHLLGQDARENFRSLYRLPASRIRALREDRLGADPRRRDEELAWLRRLPKADLHCHLGGAARPDDLPRLARAAAADAGDAFAEAEAAAADLMAWFRRTPPAAERGAEARQRIREARVGAGLPPQAFTAAVILGLSAVPAWLDLLTDPWADRGGSAEDRLRTYFAAGDLQGSSLLQGPRAIAEACRLLVERAAADRVRYLEVRCSPANLTRGGLTAAEALEAIRAGFRAACASVPGAPRVELLLIGTRHKDPEKFATHVALATADHDGQSPRVVGFDVAGDESTKSPKELRDRFEPLFRRCRKITIHAGETEPVERVWEAVYHLNADRIGHGLKLLDHPELLAHFRDRGTAVEMCPTSNDQVVGFAGPRRRDGPVYPLGQYLKRGVRVCVCTDNPGLSRTSWSEELWAAAAMTPGGLSRWDVLALVRTGFQAAFLPLPDRGDLLRRVDAEVYRTLTEEVP
ncbi:CRISPR-associated ring nuclease [Deferrisoma camini]|uniref:CRISPR-associated ring nuclease n=1 Tax=Deferrisoma camini TaxID=1035120 RepID=UPI0004AFDEA7|nr:CRISPR-associated ring nuclease [Deferrisoma camini]